MEAAWCRYDLHGQDWVNKIWLQAASRKAHLSGLHHHSLCYTDLALVISLA